MYASMFQLCLVTCVSWLGKGLKVLVIVVWCRGDFTKGVGHTIVSEKQSHVYAGYIYQEVVTSGCVWVYIRCNYSWPCEGCCHSWVCGHVRKCVQLGRWACNSDLWKVSSKSWISTEHCIVQLHARSCQPDPPPTSCVMCSKVCRVWNENYMFIELANHAKHVSLVLSTPHYT